MAFNLLAKLGVDSVSALAGHIGKAAGSVMDRIGFVKKLSEAERIDSYSKIFKISEDSTDSARQMFITEMNTQKQPWIIRLINGLVRPLGGLAAILTELYAI